MRYFSKQVTPKTTITHFRKSSRRMFEKTSLRNLLIAMLTVAIAKTFRIHEIAFRLSIVVKTKKSKQKRPLRFLEMPFPLEAVKEVWCPFILRSAYEKAATQ